MPILHVSSRCCLRVAVRAAGWLCVVAALGTDARYALAEKPDAAGVGGGIRRIVGEHLTLYTDLPPSAEVDALPGLFDQAFGSWCAYFGVDAQRHAGWHVRGHLMRSRERFEAAGFVPAEVPDFTSGFALGDQVWCYDQTSEYYRRHLLLHEGTHAFMQTLLGGVGPAWYAEGMAELLGTHHVQDGRLKLNNFPADREEVLKWGRIEIVRTDFAARRARTLPKVLAFDPRVHSENEWYGWCWAAAAFLDGHPRYRARFRGLHKLIGKPALGNHDFNEALVRSLGDDWGRVQEDWQIYVANLDYGYDFSRMDVEYAAGEPLPADGARATVDADRGWQSSGVRLQAGKKYRVSASGRYQVDDAPRIWWCEPGGVTIRYNQGKPLGILLAAVRSDDPQSSGASGLIRPMTVGLESVLTAPRDGTLYLRINDAAGSLANNAGTLTVRIDRE